MSGGPSTARARRVALFGYGNLGRFLCRHLRAGNGADPRLALAFVHNRDRARLADLAAAGVPTYSGDAGEALATYLRDHPPPDLIVEVAHPALIRRHGATFLACADLFVASITALADPAVAAALVDAAQGPAGHGLYLPAGAAWGVADVARMDRAGSLEGLTVTMTFHHDALKLLGAPAARLAAWRADPVAQDQLTVFEGSVAQLAPLAPNNVNTMTCLALAAASLGVAHTGARLIAQKNSHAHVVDVEVRGPNGFVVHTRRVNPAQPGAVTGDQTYHAFLASLRAAHGRGAGVHFC